MKSKLAKRITSLFITMSILLVSGSSILAADAIPANTLNKGDTVTAGTVISDSSSGKHAMLCIGDTTTIDLYTSGNWTADQTYTVVEKVNDNDYLYVALSPGLPISSFKKDDTIPKGTVIFDDLEMNNSKIEFDDSSIYRLSNGPWTADQDYVVTYVYNYNDYYIELFVEPAPAPQPSGTPADQLNIGDTVAVGTVICNMDSHDTDAVLVLVLDTEYYVQLAMGDWTADQTYTVTDKCTDNGMLYVTLTPSSDPGPQPQPQPQPTEGTPMSDFTVGDTIPTGTVLVNTCPNASAVKVTGQDAVWVFPNQTWTADQNYVVTKVSTSSDGSYYDLYLEPAGEPGPQPGPQPGPVDPTPIVLSPEEIREMSMTNFVENLYLNALGRTYENIGRSHWMEMLHKNATGTEIVWGFFNSQEFLSMNLSNEDYVRTLYRVFNNNATPDAANVASMAASLENGTTREQLFNQFAATEEWASICAYYAVNV